MENESNATLPSHYIGSLKKCLFEEEIRHRKTQEKLEKTEEKFQLALNEIKILHDQIAADRNDFHQRLNDLQAQCLEKDEKISALQRSCKDLQNKCDNERDIVREKDALIDHLETQIQENHKTYRKKLNEKDVHCLQERYIKQHYYFPGNTK